MRYEKSLTRFYATMLPPLFSSLIEETLKALNVKVKGPTPDEDGHLRLRVGGYDRRRQQFKGWVRFEEFHRPGVDGTYCVMDRDEVSLPVSLSSVRSVPAEN
jgi:serine/threonine-protein kinase CHEK1